MYLQDFGNNDSIVFLSKHIQEIVKLEINDYTYNEWKLFLNFLPKIYFFCVYINLRHINSTFLSTNLYQKALFTSKVTFLYPQEKKN